ERVRIRGHVARGGRRDQQFLGIPASGVAAEGGVGRAEKRGLAVAVNLVIAPVTAVIAGSCADVSGPPDRQLIAVGDSHFSSVIRLPWSAPATPRRHAGVVA